MKVLQINTVCGTGSTGRIATDIYKILDAQGHECLIAYGRGDAPKNINSIKIGNNLDNYIHVAKTRLFDLHGFSSTKATETFIEKIKEYNPDVIQLHNVHGYYINIELLFNYLKEANKPVVWTFHDCWTFTGHCSHFDYIGCKRWKDGCDSCPQKERYPKSLLMDNSKRNYERKKQLFNGIKNMTIVTPSKWLANLVNESFLRAYDVKIINNGVDLEVFKPNKKNIFRKKYNIEGKFMILGVASIWNDRKGIEHFIELSKFIDSNSIIVLVGLNVKQQKQLPQNIIGIKRTNSLEELAQIYSEADVFVNPTLEEVLGLVNLESLACGTPVITFNAGGSVECVNEKSGIIVEKDNLSELIRAVQKEKILKYDSNNCRAIAMKFDKNKKYMEYVDLYEKMRVKQW